MTSRRGAARIATTAEYIVTPGPVPCSVAVFSCSCGAEAVEFDLKLAVPAGWSTADDGSIRCPKCTERASG